MDKPRLSSGITAEMLQDIIKKWDEFYANPEQHDPNRERRMLQRLLQKVGPVEPEEAIHVAAIMKYLKEHGDDPAAFGQTERIQQTMEGIRPHFAATEKKPPFRRRMNSVTEDEPLEDEMPRRLAQTANLLDQIGMPASADQMEKGIGQLLQAVLSDKLRELDTAVRGHGKYTQEADKLHGLAQSSPSFDLLKEIQSLTERARGTKLKHALQYSRGPRGRVQPQNDDVLLDY